MTTNSCAVPTCDTGRQSVKEKRSVFRVPSNVERRQKWITAIPGISQLMPSQFVCEKHFLQRYILRKWVKRDSNGRVITEAPYARPRLDPLAVPSEFDNSNQVNSTMVANFSIEEHVKSEHSYFSTSESSTIEVENAPKDAAFVTSTLESRKIPMYTSAIHQVFNNDSSMDCSFTSTKLLSMDCSPDTFNDSIDISWTQDFKTNEMLPSDAIQSNESMQEPCHFQLSEAAFSCTTEGTTQSISIPKPWTSGELNTDGGSFIFSYVVSKVESDHNIPVTQRCVKLTPTKQLFYYVYGRIVHAHRCNLLEVLDNLGALPEALERFKNMSLCNGLGSINDHHLPPNSAFKDAVDMWRNNNCTLISKSKRCAHCVKCRDATVFSNSVAKGLRFYLSHSSEGLLKECEETIEFCKRMNDMFDALNRKTPNQGITPGNDDFKILQDCLRWPNEWEMAVKGGEISPEEYSTTETSRGLRMSPTSTMDMCCYLIEKFDFHYLLTGKVTQDNLEKFFGTIRQATGCNDQRNAPTFLQLYKLLCGYSILKPPKFGNCTVSEKHSPRLLVSLQDLKEFYSEKSEAKSLQYRQVIQAKLDNILEYDDWEADDVIEYNPGHDYSLSPICDCIIYYVTGVLF